MAGTLFLSDGCLKALLQRGTTDLKIQSLNLDLDVPREPIWVAAHYMKKSLRLQRPSLYSCITVHFHRSLSDCTWALQKIMRLINEGISFAFLQRGMKNAAMFVSITGDVHIAENWAEVNPFAVERKPWMASTSLRGYLRWFWGSKHISERQQRYRKYTIFRLIKVELAENSGLWLDRTQGPGDSSISFPVSAVDLLFSAASLHKLQTFEFELFKYSSMIWASSSLLTFL